MDHRPRPALRGRRVLGLSVRLVECGAEVLRYGMAINRIRGYYKELAGERTDLFLMSGHDDGAGVFENRISVVLGSGLRFETDDGRYDSVIFWTSDAGGVTEALREHGWPVSNNDADTAHG